MTESPSVVDRAVWQAEIDALRVREKAHTREGDAIAAARRRLPMTEVDGSTPVIGPAGSVPFRDAFEGRRLLIGYFHMWHEGHPAAEQCEGCTFFNGQVRELAYFHTRDATYATFCEGPFEASNRYREFMGWDVPWYSVPPSSVDALLFDKGGFGLLACYLRDGDQVYETYWTTDRGTEPMAPAYALLDMTVFGRQESWQDTPDGWPDAGHTFHSDGRPTAQWSRLAAGRDDTLG